MPGDSTLHVAVASLNPVKCRAVERAFRRMFPGRSFKFTPASVDSGVSDQPVGDAETLRGARNRAEKLRAGHPDADFRVGIEGGIADSGAGMASFAWIVIQSSDTAGKAKTATFYLPESVADHVRGGMELGAADDAVFGRTNSKQDAGAIGLLTGGVIDRTALYAHAVIMALIPFCNPELFQRDIP